MIDFYLFHILKTLECGDCALSLDLGTESCSFAINDYTQSVTISPETRWNVHNHALS